ncbi:MAG: phage holin family protein [Bacteroidota bacterium]
MNEQTDFLEEVGKITGYTQQYIKDQVAYQKLDMVEKSSNAISWGIVLTIVGTFAFLILLLLSIALGLYIGEQVASYPLGFLIVTGGYLLLSLLLLLLRKPLFTNPIAAKLLKKIYE